MLNKQKFLSLIEDGLPQFISDKSEQINKLLLIWNSIKFLELPFSQEALEFQVLIDPNSIYNIVSTDGSQVYPDRNEGILCYLLNIGYICVNYGKNSSEIKLLSEPFLFFNHYNVDGIAVSDNLINYQRAELELEYGLKLIFKSVADGSDFNNLYLVDGALSFFDFDNNSSNIEQNIFFRRHLELMQSFYENKILIAGYISSPRSRDIFYLVQDHCKIIDLSDLTDIDLMKLYLNEFCRSTLFRSNSDINRYYPEHLKNYFLYLNVKYEIVRIELPQWVALDNNLLNKTLSIIMDQVIKGLGFPVVLAEAHSQAVISSIDREYFYNMLYEFASRKGINFLRSQKLTKKRIMGI